MGWGSALDSRDTPDDVNMCCQEMARETIGPCRNSASGVSIG